MYFKGMMGRRTVDMWNDHTKIMCMALQPRAHVFRVYNLQTFGRAPWVEDQPVARCLPSQTTETQSADMSMPKQNWKP